MPKVTRGARTRILFVYSPLPTFVRNDLEILERHFNVKRMKITTFNFFKKGGDPLVFLKVLRNVLWADVVYCWFAKPIALFPALFSFILRKKSVVVVGGFEVAYVPQMNYGLMLRRWSAITVKCVFRFVDKILAVSQFSRREILNYATHEKIQLLYNGIDCDRFRPHGKKHNDLVLMVGPIAKDEIKIHGLDTFIETAKRLPKVKFLAIGLSEDAIDFFKSKPPNVTLMGLIPHENLLAYYQKAKVYCQLSFRESFGVALAEAMCCECVPVVTKNGGAMLEVVGDTGFLARFNDPSNVAEMIRKAMKSDSGEEARERVREYFSIARRESALVNLVERWFSDEER